MIALEDIRSLIVQGLSTHVGKEVIEMNGEKGIPVGGYITYDFSNGFHSTRGFPVVTQGSDKLVKMETIQFTMTFLSYDHDKTSRIQNALKAKDWFKTAGHTALKERVNVVVVKIGSVSNRDIQVNTVWERRQGFDVEFRTVDIVESDLEWIEQTNIQRS